MPAKGYKAGDLDQLVTFERLTKTSDGMGGNTSAWNTLATDWALVRPMTGQERLVAGGVESSAHYLFVVRARTDITEKDRINWNGVSYNIRLVKNRPRAKWLELEGERGVAQ